jgi:hypothetical protein
MKSHTIEWNTINTGSTTIPTVAAAGNLNNLLGLASRMFMAVVPAIAIITASAWLITAPDLVVYLQASLWALGFVYLGLAIESEESAMIASLATGIALPVLALLSSRVAVELAILAAALVAGWVAVVIFRRSA